LFIARQQIGKEVPAEMNAHATIEEPVSKQRFGKYVTVATDTDTTIEERCFYAVCAEL
jgi:hypothetical protein